ncbi:YncE family protein [Paenibacillus flagellatus]|uniref:Uncharacterized protein n=1 Tax=Paenibacillus flagellatus TaxID=2211139 RepID=A0A2V5K434_9BACL|nr:PQQ-binding-like beta-propeller repeat protein [Paenibacillus flagellatus]PYI54011.1 hypothetical protein DLM86_15805 [Paenibacillus flagellatus]
MIKTCFRQAKVSSQIAVVTVLGMLGTALVPASALAAPSEPVQASATSTVTTFTYEKTDNRIRFSQSLAALEAGPDGGYLYALSEGGKRLVSIDANAFEVVGEKTFPTFPKKLQHANGKLYVGLPDSRTVAAFDTSNGTTVAGDVYEYRLNGTWTTMAVGSEDIYYAGSSEIRKYHLMSGQDTVVTALANGQPTFDLLLDEPSQSLYVGTMDRVLKIDAATGAVTAQTSTLYRGQRLSKFGDTLYWGNQSLNAVDLRETGSHSDYMTLFADEDRVYTAFAVYNRETGAKEFEYEASTLMQRQGTDKVYLFHPNNQTLVKYDSLEALRQDSPANRIPSQSPSWGQFISSALKLSWTKPFDERFITHYVIYFLDEHKNKLGEAIAEIPKRRTRFIR